MTWRGDKTLPLLYFPFFTLSSLFIGEVLPVVIGIFAGKFNTYGAKEPIIKTLPDFGLVLIIYTAFGLLFWLLYRFVNWKIVAVFGLVLAFVLERYVYWQVEGSVNVANYISFGTILNHVIVYLLVLVFPYAVFQTIRRRWGMRSSVILVLILLALNILGLIFTYYQMVKTDRWHKYSSESTGKQQSDSTKLLPPNICPDRLVEVVGKPTIAYLKGKAFKLTPDIDNWVRTNCPKALQRIIPESQK